MTKIPFMYPYIKNPTYSILFIWPKIRGAPFTINLLIEAITNWTKKIISQVLVAISRRSYV